MNLRKGLVRMGRLEEREQQSEHTIYERKRAKQQTQLERKKQGGILAV